MRLLLLSSFALLLSCGDPLVNGRYQGSPLFLLSGQVNLFDEEDFSAYQACDEALTSCFERHCELPCPAPPLPHEACFVDCQSSPGCFTYCDKKLDDLERECGFIEHQECEERYEQALYECLQECDEGSCVERCEPIEDLGCEEWEEIDEERCIECDGQFEECVQAAESKPTPWQLQPEALRVGLFWLHQAGSISSAKRIEQAVETSARFPAHYELRLHHAPPKEALRSRQGGGESALALILVYLDQDGDERWLPGVDRLLGGAGEVALLFTSEALKTEEGSWSSGYHPVLIHQDCEAPDGSLHFEPTDASADVYLSTNPEALDLLSARASCDELFSLCPPEGDLDFICAEPIEDPWLCARCRGEEIPEKLLLNPKERPRR